MPNCVRKEIIAGFRNFKTDRWHMKTSRSIVNKSNVHNLHENSVSKEQETKNRYM